MKPLDTFTRAYIETALWSSLDESDESGGDPMDINYTVADIAPETLAMMVADCAAFQGQFGHIINDDNAFLRCGHGYDQLAHAGHDFWLTRNGHGAGFWDGDWCDDVEDELTRGAKAFGDFGLYIGDDGRIHKE